MLNKESIISVKKFSLHKNLREQLAATQNSKSIKASRYQSNKTGGGCAADILDDDDNKHENIGIGVEDSQENGWYGDDPKTGILFDDEDLYGNDRKAFKG